MAQLVMTPDQLVVRDLVSDRITSYRTQVMIDREPDGSSATSSVPAAVGTSTAGTRSPRCSRRSLRLRLRLRRLWLWLWLRLCRRRRRNGSGLSRGLTGAPDAPPADLALQFELRVPDQPNHGRGIDRPSINLRPVTRGQNGKWVRSGVAWSSLRLFTSVLEGGGFESATLSAEDIRALLE